MYKVLKKDGRQEDFDWKKLKYALTNAGATEDEVEKVATGVEEWLNTVADANDGLIKSYDLHVKVIEILKEVNIEVGTTFENFRKPDPNIE